MVNTPGLLKPFKESSRGASLNVMVSVRAPIKIAAGGSLVNINNPKVITKMAMVM